MAELGPVVVRRAHSPVPAHTVYLHYGKTWSAGGLTCTEATRGLTCRNRECGARCGHCPCHMVAQGKRAEG
jgi:hypothetical protein